jgi:hypothetical protein
VQQSLIHLFGFRVLTGSWIESLSSQREQRFAVRGLSGFASAAAAAAGKVFENRFSALQG